MRKLFPGYYSPVEHDTEKQWAEGIFIFDTSVLLNLYSYPEQAREEFLSILEGLADRTWIPYQVMVEFHRNRYKRINSANRAVIDLKANLQKALQTTKEGFTAIQFEKRNTGVDDIGKRISDFDASGKSLLAALEEACKRLNQVGLADDIALRLSAMYEGKIGDSPENQDELNKLVEDADDRFENKIPPGFADLKDKTSVEFHRGLRYETKYGDLVVWRQILNHIRTLPDSRVVLVTAERKVDFWLKDDKEKIIGPLPELVNEFLSETKAASFWLYSAEDFLQEAKVRGGNVVSADTIKEVRDISMKFDVPTIFDDVDKSYKNFWYSRHGSETDGLYKKSDVIALLFIASRYPNPKVKRSDSGWLVDDLGSGVFIQPLVIDSVDLGAISKFANEMVEPIIYGKTILLLIIPDHKWQQMGPSAAPNLQRVLRKIMVSASIDEIIISFHDESMTVTEWLDTKAVED